MTAYNEILINPTSENSPQSQINSKYQIPSLPPQHYQSLKLLSAFYLPATRFIAHCLLFKTITIFFADRNFEIISNNFKVFLPSNFLHFALFQTL